MQSLLDLKSTVNRNLRKIGYEIRTVGKPGGEFEQVIPMATYSPWNLDSEFLAVFKQIRSNSMTDIFRCYGLWSLVEQCAKLPGGLLEVGTWRGGSGALIAKKAQLCGIHEPVYLCDTFKGVVKATSKDSSYNGGEHANTSRQIVEQLLKHTGVTNAKILEGIFPDDTGGSVETKQIKFCHIDVDVYQSAKDTLEWVWPKLPIGGIVVYDDYGFEGLDGIRTHLDEEKSRADRLFFHNLNGHAILIKIA